MVFGWEYRVQSVCKYCGGYTASIECSTVGFGITSNRKSAYNINPDG